MRFDTSSPTVLREDWRNGGFGLYIHWPFCQSKCPYCDFNSHVVADIRQAAWRSAYLSEIDRIAALTPGRILNSVFFGGGTPSLMDPETVAILIERIAARWTLANDLETTLEANPTSIEYGRFRAFNAAGINRVSIGIQALNDADLSRLGRLHSVKEAYGAFDIARQTFERVSFDLIYARQFQTADAWHLELAEALDLAADHLSLYQLTIEPGTAFGDRAARGRLPGLPDEDAQADMYEVTQDLCEAAGFSAYEVSNHAQPGAESRHNLIYWRYGDCAGIGPGAHGRLTLDGRRHRTETELNPEAWLQAVKRNGSGETLCLPLPLEDQVNEYLMMGLRITGGIDLCRLEYMGYRPPKDELAGLEELGLLERQGDFLRATAKGRPVLNGIYEKLLTG
ncbi:MAG: radical SAM family heme chaperone HemW [Pseudomonadota bacterium]